MKKWKSYAIGIGLALGVGVLSALLTRDGMDLYQSITQPPLAPPSWLFPVVWTVLFVLMGISSAMIGTAEGEGRGQALTVYGYSLAVNFIWSILFFSYRLFVAAFIWLLLLLYLIIRTIVLYRPIRPVAAWLQLPYAVWVAFAGYLNLAIAILN